MVNWFIQTIRIFAHFSIQTIQTLNFIFVSALDNTHIYMQKHRHVCMCKHTHMCTCTPHTDIDKDTDRQTDSQTDTQTHTQCKHVCVHTHST